MKFIRVLYQFIIRNWVWIYPVIETIYSYLKRTVKMERIGIFTPEQEKFITEVLKSFIKDKNKFMSWIKFFALKWIIKGVDNLGLDRIRNEWKSDLIPIVDAGMNKEYEKVRQLTTDLLNKKIDFKDINEETELRLFDSLTRFIAAAIDFFIQKQRIAV
jgi:hypothetical protein